MADKKMCRWYETCSVKRAYDRGLIEEKWVADYCWIGGPSCMRKKWFEEEGRTSPDYVLPDGSVAPQLK